MPFAPHVRISALGYLAAANLERFSYGICMARTDGGAPTWLGNEINDAYYEDLSDSVVAFHGRAASLISAAAWLETVKIASIGADGKYVDDPRIFEVGQAGGVAINNYVLPQNALAVSLGTDLRGPSGKGRFFIPMPTAAAAYTETYHIAQALAEGCRDSAKTMLDDLNNAPGLDSSDSLNVVVASTKGFNTLVTEVRVGKVIDTIRSRRNKIPELYTDPVAVAS